MAGYMINNIPSDADAKLNFDSVNKQIKPVSVNVKVSDQNIKNNNYISSKKINSISYNTSDLNSQKDVYSNSDFSSKSNIYINKIANDINNSIKNKLNNEEYEFYKTYLMGKQVKDIINSDGTFNKINIQSQNINESSYQGNIFSLIDSINSKIDKFNKSAYPTSYDRKLMDSRFTEIVTDKSGFDAIVLENDDEYWVVAACCDNDSKEDVMAISYALLYQITGSDDIWRSLASLLVNDDGKIGQFDVKELANAEKYYSNQREDNIKLIKKYNNKGKKLCLGGYSLGGGIMLDSYARLKLKDPIKFEDTTLTLFNPFMTYLEIDSKNYNNQSDVPNINDVDKAFHSPLSDINNVSETLIDTVKNSKDNVLIYSTEGDTVSQFNNLTKTFKNQMIYVKGNENIDVDLNDINEVINLIMGENSRHGFKGIDDNAFDKKGNLIVEGDQITINEIVGGNTSTNNLGTIMETIINRHLQKTVGNYLNSMPEDQEWMKDDISNMYFDFRKYLIQNAGHYDQKEIIKILSPSLTNLLKKGALKENAFAWIPNMFINEQTIEKSLTDYVNTKDGKQHLQDILDYCMLGDMNNGANKLQGFMTKIYYQTDAMKYITDIQNEYEKGRSIGLQFNNQEDMEPQLPGKTL